MPISRSRSGCPAVREPSWRNFLSSSMRERIAGEMQQRVQQHRAVAVREHEAVAVPPVRVAGVVLEHVAPQHLGNVGHAHGRAGMSRIRGLHGIHGERADGIGQGAAGGGCGWGIHKGRALSDRGLAGATEREQDPDTELSRDNVDPRPRIADDLGVRGFGSRRLGPAPMAAYVQSGRTVDRRRWSWSPGAGRAAAAAQARSASTIHLSDSSGADTRITLRIAKPASRNSCSSSLRDTRDSGGRPRPSLPKVCVST